MVNVECVSDFNEQPDLHLSFYYNGVMQNVDIKLPVSFLPSILPNTNFVIINITDHREQVH